MSRLTFCAAVGILASFLLSDAARAQQFLLDSGTPTSGTYPILSNADWFAGEFSATAGETITQLSTYITSMSGNGNNFAFDLYTDGGGTFLNTRNSSLSSYLELSATGTFTTAGWTSTSVNWTVPTTGNYWLAVQGNTAGTHNLPTFDVEAETSTTTGTVPALAFAFDTGTQYKTSGAAAIGLEVTATPEPSSWILGLIGAGSLVYLRRRAAKRA